MIPRISKRYDMYGYNVKTIIKNNKNPKINVTPAILLKIT